MPILFEVSTDAGDTYAIDYDGRNYTVVEAWMKPVKPVVVDGQLVTPATVERAWRPVKRPYCSAFATAAKRLFELGLEQRDHQAVATLAWQMDAWCARIEAAVRACGHEANRLRSGS